MNYKCLNKDMLIKVPGFNSIIKIYFLFKYQNNYV